jgi:ankyrin repeat protein
MLGAIQAAGGHELRVLVPCAAPSGQAGHVGVPLIEQAMTGHNPGATPLYAAACGGSLRCAKLLCEAGAKIDARTQNDASPMLVSCQVRVCQRTQHERTAPAQQPSGPGAPPRHPT